MLVRWQGSLSPLVACKKRLQRGAIWLPFFIFVIYLFLCINFCGARKLNLNRATLSDLEALPGIGKVLASRIVNYRKIHGKFVNISELKNIKGIGEKKFKLLKRYLYVDPESFKENSLKSFSSNLEPKVFYYTDENGTYHFTQFPEKVPKKYRSTLKLWKK